MKKLMLITALAGASLVAAAPPGHWRTTSADDGSTDRGYPPCSRTVKDRCIQLYERGVATRANLALNERLGRDGPRMAMGGPYEPSYGAHSGHGAMAGAWPRTSSSDYPPCSRTVKDRCIQLYERGIRGHGH